MPQRSPDSANEYSQDNAGSTCRSITVPSAATWDKQQTTVLVRSLGEEEDKRGDRIASAFESSHHLVKPQPWWESQLAKDIHSNLQGREKMLSTVKFESPQLNIRYINQQCAIHMLASHLL